MIILPLSWPENALGSHKGPLPSRKVLFDDMPGGLLALNDRCNSKEGEEDGWGKV